MVQINFNAQQVAPNVTPEPIPSGQYKVHITGSEEKPTSSGGKQLVFEMQVLDGEFKGRKVFDRLNIVNTGPNKQQTEDIAYGTLSAICHVTQRLQIQSTDQLHGVPFTAIVVKKPRGDDPTRDTNEVRGYLDVNGQKPGFAGATQGGGTPSWAGQQQGAANPPPPPPPANNPPPPPPAAFPPAGWVAHPSAPGYFYQGDQVLSEADLRAKFAPPPAPPAPPAAPPAPPPVPQNNAANPPPPPAAGGEEPPPWLRGQA